MKWLKLKYQIWNQLDLRVLTYTGYLAEWLECLPMVRETGVQSLVELYQRLKKWYLMPRWLTLNIVRYRSRVSRVVPFPVLQCVAIGKGGFESPTTRVDFTYIYIYMCVWEGKIDVKTTLHSQIIVYIMNIDR